MRLIVPIVASLLLATIGCQKPEPVAPADLPPLPAGTFDSAEAVARATLDAARQQLEAVRARRTPESVAWLNRLTELAASEQIRAGVERAPVYKTVLGDDPVHGIVKNWPVTIAHYLDKIRIDQLATQPGNQSIVLVPAGEATIRLTCVRDAADRWHVLRLDFAPRGTTSAPAG